MKMIINKLTKKQCLLLMLINIILDFWIYAIMGVGLDCVLYCLCTSLLLIISVTDWFTYEIPVECNIFIGILGLVRLMTDLSNSIEYVIGFILVSGILLLVYCVTKGQGIGGGDIKLMAAAGLLIGGPKILLAFIIGSIVGIVIHLIFMKQKKGHLLAFGPYLSFGIFLSMLYGEGFITWYCSFM